MYTKMYQLAKVMDFFRNSESGKSPNHMFNSTVMCWNLVSQVVQFKMSNYTENINSQCCCIIEVKIFWTYAGASYSLLSWRKRSRVWLCFLCALIFNVKVEGIMYFALIFIQIYSITFPNQYDQTGRIYGKNVQNVT